MSVPPADRPIPGPRGARPGTDRLAALFAAAAVAFNPPLLRVFGAGDLVFGLPLLYLYVFAVWLGVIVLLAVHVERRGSGG